MAEKRNKFLREIKINWDQIEKKVQMHKRKKLKQAAMIAAACVVVFAVGYIFLQLKTYGKYRVVNSIERDDTAATKFDLFDGNILKYSNDGVFYTDIRNNLIWNQTFEMKDPIMAQCEEYVAFADKGGQDIYILNTEGPKSEIETEMAIQDVQVAANGTTAVLMESEGTGYIALYNNSGEMLAEGELHMENSGYPLGIALSSNGEMLAVSVLDVNKGSVNTTISFYNFGKAGQNKVDNIVASYSYENCVIPEMLYVSENRMLAFGDSGVKIFTGSQKPKEGREIKADGEIKSVFYDDTYFGLVYSDKKNENQRKIVIYDMRGGKKTDADLGIAYDNIYFLSNHEICVQNETQCEIYTLHGVRKFRSDFNEKNLYYVTARKGIRNYSFMMDGETDQVRLRFFSTAR